MSINDHITTPINLYGNIGLKFKVRITDKSTPYIQIVLYDNSIWFGWRKP